MPKTSEYITENGVKTHLSIDCLLYPAIVTVISKMYYGLSLYGAVSPLPFFYGDMQIGCKTLFKKLEIAMNHVCRVIIGYKGKYQDMDIAEL